VSPEQPLVGILVGSESDCERMQPALDELTARGISHELEVRSAHRTPEAVADYCKGARGRGLRVIIAGAGLAAALPGVAAAHTDLPAILSAARACAARTPRPAEPFQRDRGVPAITGYVPERMVSDPAGYFVVYPDPRRGLLALEHYQNNGVLDVVIEGHSAAELYVPAVEKGLLSRLDHAATHGRRTESDVSSARGTGETWPPLTCACIRSPRRHARAGPAARRSRAPWRLSG